MLLCGVLLYARVFWVDPDELEPNQLNAAGAHRQKTTWQVGFLFYADFLQRFR